MKTEGDCTLTMAIDGPAASGKTVVGKEISRRLGIRFLDTGSMYRAITWAAIQRDIPIDNFRELSLLAARAKMRLDATPSKHMLLLDGDDISDRIRLPEVDAKVSAVSAISGVRIALVQQQRMIAAEGPIVMCGRDIGTVVLPDASVKVFLTASTEARAARRAAEMRTDDGMRQDQVLAALLRRDKIDSERDDSPLRPADDAFVICSDRMTIDEVVEEIMSEVRPC